MRRFIEVEFRAGGKRYAYGYDGELPIEPGVDRVEISTRDGLGTFRVLGVSEKAPDLQGRELQFILSVLPRPAFDPLKHTGDPAAQ